MTLDERIYALAIQILDAAESKLETQIAGIIIAIAGAACDEESTDRLACLISQFVDKELNTMEKQ